MFIYDSLKIVIKESIKQKKKKIARCLNLVKLNKNFAHVNFYKDFIVF